MTLTRYAKTDGQSAASSAPPRERILLAARELFYRDGINSVGVEAIAEAAQTNKMTLYRHFRSKDELIVAYAGELADEGEAIWTRINLAHPDDPQRRLAAWIDYVEDILTNRFERGCALANAAVELPSQHPARTVIEAYKERKRNNLVALFEAARYREPDRLADEVFLLFEGARINIQCGTKGPASRVAAMLRQLLATAPQRGRR